MGTRFVAVQEEAVYGTRPAWTPKWMPFLEYDITPQRNVIKLEESYRMQDDGAIYGGYVETGNLRMLARPDNMGELLDWLFGSVTTTTVDDMKKHRYTPAETTKSFSMEVATGITDSITHLGCVAKGLTLEASQGNPALATWDIQAREEDVQYAASTFATPPVVRPFVLADATATVFGNVLKAESITFNVERDVPDNAHTSGSMLLPNIITQGFKMSGEMQCRFESLAQRQDFFGLAGASDTPQEEVQLAAVSIGFDGAPSGLTHDSYDLDISLPQCVLTENPISIRGRDKLMQRVVFESIYNASNFVDLWNITATPA